MLSSEIREKFAQSDLYGKDQYLEREIDIVCKNIECGSGLMEYWYNFIDSEEHGDGVNYETHFTVCRNIRKKVDKYIEFGSLNNHTLNNDEVRAIINIISNVTQCEVAYACASTLILMNGKTEDLEMILYISRMKANVNRFMNWAKKGFAELLIGRAYAIHGYKYKIRKNNA